jgi:hypothetical protein
MHRTWASSWRCCSRCGQPALAGTRHQHACGCSQSERKCNELTWNDSMFIVGCRLHLYWAELFGWDNAEPRTARGSRQARVSAALLLGIQT